jgi:hypothetical protein
MTAAWSQRDLPIAPFAGVASQQEGLLEVRVQTQEDKVISLIELSPTSAEKVKQINQ